MKEKTRLIKLHISNPIAFVVEVLMNKISQLFPYYSIQLFLGNSHKIHVQPLIQTLPQVLEFDNGSHLRLPIELLNKIPRVNIIIKSIAFNVKLEGTGKLGNNTWLQYCFKFECPDEYQIPYFTLKYYNFVDINQCNFKVFTDDGNIQSAKALFLVLQRYSKNPKGIMHFEFIEKYDLNRFQKDFKEVQGNFRFSLLSFKDSLPEYCKYKEVRVQILRFDLANEIDTSSTRFIVEERLVLRIASPLKCIFNLLDCIVTLPDYLLISVTNDQLIPNLISVLLFIQEKKKDLKELIVKICSFQDNLIDQHMNLYSTIGSFTKLEKLTISVPFDTLAWLGSIKTIMKECIFLRKIQIGIVKNPEKCQSDDMEIQTLSQANQQLMNAVICRQRHCKFKINYQI
ncbi:hypothetical protein FGO68_gene13213 [Halteria grandinella]|uniref:Uncharacterized protein n=1 Tax=Halteria grandinella TaxID=5974 RepID=A0A8J8NGW2_HALGN|nr:hypothetical protein FGO68_gene13213 [Halteria grandinella]